MKIFMSFIIILLINIAYAEMALEALYDNKIIEIEKWETNRADDLFLLKIISDANIPQTYFTKITVNANKGAINGFSKNGQSVSNLVTKLENTSTIKNTYLERFSKTDEGYTFRITVDIIPYDKSVLANFLALKAFIIEEWKTYLPEKNQVADISNQLKKILQQPGVKVDIFSEQVSQFTLVDNINILPIKIRLISDGYDDIAMVLEKLSQQKQFISIDEMDINNLSSDRITLTALLNIYFIDNTQLIEKPDFSAIEDELAIVHLNLPKPGSLEFQKTKTSAMTTTSSPDIYRPKEVLESYSIEELVVIGVMAKKNRQYALVKTPENTLYTVIEGSYIGLNSGLVTKITNNRIYYTETIADEYGEFKQYHKYLEISQ